MYLIELIIKKLTQKKEDKSFLENSQLDHESCEHVFMPVDSTNGILSCTKCGFLVKRSELKNKNFFVQDKSDLRAH